MGTDDHPDLRAEVQAFYDWYLAADHSGRTVGTVLIERPQVFSDELRGLLLADDKCKEETQGICNLDFDPFTASQDPCDRYEVREPASRGDTIAFAIRPKCPWMGDTVPALTALVLPVDSGFQFANLVYRRGDDLRSLLSRPHSE